MWNWGNGHMDNGWGFMMVLGMVGVWAVIGVLIFWVVSTIRNTHSANGLPPLAQPSPPSASATSGAEQILAERLARGDIDAEEYAARLEALTSQRRS